MQVWTILGTLDEASFLDEHIRAIIAQERDPLPPREQRIGHVDVRWDQVGPKSAFLQALGGSVDDRILARAVVAAQLVSRGFREATYDFDSLRRTADWNDVMTKAKRLIQQGNVKLLRNGYENVVGWVKGDHGEYEPEIYRQDPSSRAITGSFCDCDWGEFQNQPRTRQFKKFQDRPCSHVLALFWQSLATPLDEDIHPDNGGGGGGPAPPEPQPQEGQLAMPGPSEPGGGLADPGAGRFRLSPQPPRGLVGPDQMSLMAPGAGGPQAPAQAAPGPSPRDVLPQFPMEGQAQQQIQPSSIPGGRGPTPTNPINYPAGPGGALSSIRRGDGSDTDGVNQPVPGFVNGDLVQLRYPDTATLVGRSEAHGAGQETTIRAGQVGSVLGTHPSTGFVNVLYMGKPWDQNGRMEPYGATGWHFPSYLIPRPDLKQPGPAIRRTQK